MVILLCLSCLQGTFGSLVTNNDEICGQIASGEVKVCILMVTCTRKSHKDLKQTSNFNPVLAVEMRYTFCQNEDRAKNKDSSLTIKW